METLRLEVNKLRRQIALALRHDRFYFAIGTVALAYVLRKWLRKRNRDRAINRFLREVMARENKDADAMAGSTDGGGSSSPMHRSASSNFARRQTTQMRASRSMASFLSAGAGAGATRAQGEAGIRRNKSIHRLQKLLQTAGGPPICEDCFSRTSR